MPTDAASLSALMMEIWDDDPHSLYNDWHNARDVAEAAGAIRLYGYVIDDERGYYYQFPEGGKVFIATHGSCVIAPRNRKLGKGMDE